ncbi:UPF0502 protein Acid_1185 [Candidatus Moduliflexus flocculans]|uniref:UPF0502 protein Acid_1185 n=1 Tax=Candidatus Moduliflexus flocculans TaxID=1499966 RepID=A0A081BN87_9BACT|nr:UPF0502 protein Acid_1185 [Candidatus Moduliflexus flocculans]
MKYMLTVEELRVLGSLLEKKMTTPEYYPLSLNALITACNQKVNREPVTTYGDTTVLRALKGLKAKGLVLQSASVRVAKYEECFCEQANITEEEAAILGVLMLRGAQTPGELRARTERMASFPTLDDVTDMLNSLIEMGYVKEMPRKPGQKEARYRHEFGEVQAEEVSEDTTSELPIEDAREEVAEARPERADRLAALERKVAALSAELAELKEAFHQFEQQFQ